LVINNLKVARGIWYNIVESQTRTKEMLMRDNLRVYHTILAQICKWLPDERITRVRNLALFLTGLYLGAKVHLPFIVRKWPTAGKVPSLVNRLRRFLTNPRVSVWDFYRPVAERLVGAFRGQPIRLIIDCTKLGFNYQLMTVAIAYRKRALPLVWSVHHGKKGSIAAKKQIALLRQVGRLLPSKCQVWVIGDCGFQHVPLLRWLRRRDWHFVIRQSGHLMVRRAGGKWVKLANIPLKEGETRYWGWVRLTEKHNYGWVYLVLHWEVGEEKPWYLVTDRQADWRTIRLYKVRMWIEEMYGDMKGHGFDLEATHLQDLERLSRLVLGVCLVYTWLITLGGWVVKSGRRHLVDRKDRRDKSYFRIGWDWIERCLSQGQSLRLQFVPYT
jgi:hypothetical protein